MIDQQLLDILVCPLGKAPLKVEDNHLVCTRCGAIFSFTREGYPNLVIEDAQLPEGIKRIEDLVCAKSQLDT